MSHVDPVATATLDPLPVSRPSIFVRIAMGPMTRILNPLITRVAGRRHMNMAAQIHHRGRRSGRAYVTPASARLDHDAFWVPLTFGTGSDWCRNVLAAGGCTVRWRGEDHVTVHPVVVDRATAMSAARGAFRAPERLMLRMLGITHFLRLDVAHT
jgi:deazaflavin-dependent oxidoreductase (nitroreductase family)